VNGEIESLGLLVEEERSNLKPYSEELQSDFGRASITTISENEIISPDGLQTADGIVPNGTDTAHYLDKVFTSTSGITTSQNICCSVFVKKGTGRDFWLQIYEESGNAYHGVQFNFQTESLTFQNSAEYTTGGGVTTEYDFIKYPNGWYRLWVAGYPNTTTTGRRYRIRLTDASGNLNFSGDTVSSYVYAWGVQVEKGAFPTSYIPRPDASTATREPDNASMVGDNFSDWYNPSEGTIYCSYKNNTTDSTKRKNVYAIQGTSSGIEIRSPNIDFNRLRFVFNGNFNSNPTEFSATLNQRKTGFSYDQTQHNGCIDGTLVTHAEGHSNDNTKNILYIGNREQNSEDYLNGTISQFTYYPTRLTNAQLQTLTK